jgi:hypothetical protein
LVSGKEAAARVSALFADKMSASVG